MTSIRDVIPESFKDRGSPYQRLRPLEQTRLAI
jgi:hypothetical protein